jgi:acetyltransferase-like isoleucine patch superfamily enzyme
MLKIIKNKIRKVIFGKNCKIVEPVNLYECKLGNSVFIGPFVEVQKNVTIGDFSRISSHTFVCELVTIGKNCFIGHGVFFVNDLFKDGKFGKKNNGWKKTIIGNNVKIGSGSTILPVNIGNNIVIGAGSVVTKNLKISGIYAGNPAKLLRKFKIN